MDEIYIDRGDGELAPVRAAPYDSEDVLQELLARHPDLLAGNQMVGDEPRRWLLIGREMGVPSSEDGYDHFLLDHLFVDQDGVPTLVEVKRSGNTDLRRKVIGQMLDYAANGIVYWRIDRLRSLLAARVVAEGPAVGVEAPEGATADRLADAEVASLLRVGADPDGWGDEIGTFWDIVEQNLREGRMRLVFVADAIPRELQRIIEFLNEQLRNAEVLGVEVKMYAGPDVGVKAYVPRVVGQTVAAEATKGPRDRRTYVELLEAAPRSFRAAVKQLEGWAGRRGLDVSPSRRSLRVAHDGVTVLWAYPGWNSLQLSLVELRDRPGGAAVAEELLETCRNFGRTGDGVDYPVVDPAVVAELWCDFEKAVLETLVAGLGGG